MESLLKAGVGFIVAKDVIKTLKEDFPGSRCFGNEECKSNKRSSGECIYDGREPRKNKLRWEQQNAMFKL